MRWFFYDGESTYRSLWIGPLLITWTGFLDGLSFTWRRDEEK